MVFEVLISTMNKDNLSFLNKMFANIDYSKMKILIINQTTSSNLLKIDNENVRVINSFETGLPQSRNLAIENAIGDICLIADDDIIYERNFIEDILNCYKNNINADIITFQMTDEIGDLFKNYKNQLIHDFNTIKTVNSVVISFKRKMLVKNNIRFNPYFGLGADFEAGDEYIFLRTSIEKELKALFIPITILSHKYLSSGRDNISDKIIFARSALSYKYYGFLAYLKLVKYVFYFFLMDGILLKEILNKIIVGYKGIKKLKSLEMN